MGEFDWLNPPQLSREDRAVVGCDCTGLRLHTLECSLWSLGPEAAEAAIADAEARVAAHTAWLNTALRSWQGARRV